MNLIKLIKENKMEFIQMKVLVVVFLIFFLNVFFTLPSFLFYILIVAIIVNIIFGIINKKRRIFMNIILLSLALLQFMFLVGYFATIFGTGITLVYLVIDGFSFFKK